MIAYVLCRIILLPGSLRFKLEPQTPKSIVLGNNGASDSRKLSNVPAKIFPINFTVFIIHTLIDDNVELDLLYLIRSKITQTTLTRNNVQYPKIISVKTY